MRIPLNIAKARPGSMAWGLILFNLFVVVALAVMTVGSLRHLRETEEGRARDVVDNLAQSLSAEIGAEFRNADNALATVALRFRSAPDSKDHEQTLLRILEEQRSLLPQVRGLRIADIRGDLVAGLDDNQASFNVFDRPYFAQAMMSAGLVISEPQQSRMDGKWGIVLARRLINHDGQFAGVVSAVITSKHFVDRFSRVALGPAGAVSLRSGELSLIARFSASEPTSTKGFGGRVMSDQLLASLRVNRERGWYLTETKLDNVERITAYRRVPGYDLTLFTGMSSTDFLLPWRRQAWQESLMAVAVALVVMGASWLIHRHYGRARRARRALARLAREQELMLQNDLVGMVRVRGNRSTWCNPAVERMFGYEPGELTDQPAQLLFLDPAEQARIAEVGSAAIRAGERFRTQLRMRRKDGTAFWVDLSGTVLSAAESLWMFADIDALKQSEEQAHDLALRDALTHLPNRRLFEQKVAGAIASAQASTQRFAVCYLDLDGFKPINDQYGHEAGDEVLTQVANRLQALVRADDVVARLGGDEFAILLNGVRSAHDAEQLLQRVLYSIQRQITLDTGERVTVNASVGAVMGGGADVGRTLLRSADEAMYAVKRKGKGRIRIVDAELEPLAAAA